MKITLIPVLAALVLSSGASASTLDTPKTTDGLRLRFNEACDTLARKASARQATREDFNNAVEAMRAVANQYLDEQARVPTMREKVAARIQELETRARTAAWQLGEVDVLKDMAIDTCLMGCLARMKARVLEGKSTRLEFAMVYEALTARAEYAKAFDPEIDAIAGRLDAEVRKLQARVDAAKPILPPDLAVIDAAGWQVFQHAACARLGRRALVAEGVRPVNEDYTDVMESLIWAGEPENSEFARKVAARLDDFKAAVAGGRITRSDYESLRDLLRQRAREALSGS